MGIKDTPSDLIWELSLAQVGLTSLSHSSGSIVTTLPLSQQLREREREREGAKETD